MCWIIFAKISALWTQDLLSVINHNFTVLMWKTNVIVLMKNAIKTQKEWKMSQWHRKSGWRDTSLASSNSWFPREVSHPNADQARPRWVYEIWQGNSRGWNGCSELMRLFQLLLLSQWLAMLQPSVLLRIMYNEGICCFINVSAVRTLKLVFQRRNGLTRCGNKRVILQRNIHCKFKAERSTSFI